MHPSIFFCLSNSGWGGGEPIPAANRAKGRVHLWQGHHPLTCLINKLISCLWRKPEYRERAPAGGRRNCTQEGPGSSDPLRWGLKARRQSTNHCTPVLPVTGTLSRLHESTFTRTEILLLWNNTDGHVHTISSVFLCLHIFYFNNHRM